MKIVIIILTAIIFMIGTDTGLLQTIKDLETKIEAIGRARQPYIADWIEVSEASTGAVNGTISFTDTTIDTSKIFAVGDKLRLKQGGAYKYFYVILTSGNTIKVSGGSQYSLTASDVTELAFSKHSKPSGHPVTLSYFNFAEVSVVAPSNITVYGYISSFYMIGSMVYWTGYIDYEVTSSSTLYIFAELPVQPLNTAYPVSMSTCIGNVGGSYEVIKNELSLVSYEDKISFSRVNYTNFSIGIGSVNWSVAYSL